MKIPENFDRWMFDYKEGNLSPTEAEAFENFLIQHPEYEVDMDAWDQAFVTSEPVIYPDAHKLEKKRKVGGWYAWSAAAALVFLLGTTAVYVLSGNDDELLTGSGIQNGASTLYTNGADGSSLNTGSNPSTNSSNSTVGTLADQALSRLIAGFTGSTQSGTTGHNPQDGSHNGSLMFNNPGNGFVNGTDPNGNIEPGQTGSVVTNPTDYSNYVGDGSTVSLVSGEVAKLRGEEHNAKYNGNPTSKNLGFDVSKKTVAKYKPLTSKMKRLYHNIERSLRYPAGIANLRDPELSLPQTNILAFNPAMTGGMLRSRFDMSYRHQWTGTDMMSQEMNISFDKYSSEMRGGVGVLVHAQDYGMGQFSDYNVSLFYSPKFMVNKNIMIEPAVKLTMGTLVANGDKLQPDAAFEMDRGRVINTIGADEMNGTSQLWYKDYGFGLMVNGKKFYAGFSADNLGGHYENVYGNDLSSPTQTPIKFTAVAGLDKPKNQYNVSPFVAYQQFGSQPEFWGGVNFKMNNVVLGGSINTNKEFTVSAGIKRDKFKLIYRFDMTESVVMNDYVGSHSIGIRFNAKSKNRLTN